MFTLVILYTLYTLLYPVYPCLPYSYCIPCVPLYILCTHVYPSNAVYPVNPYISYVAMFTLVTMYTLFTLIYPVYPCLPQSYSRQCIPCIPLYILCTFHFPLSYKKTSHLIRLINGEFFLFLLISPCVKKKCPIFLLSFLCHFPLLLRFTMVNFCNFCRK